jgi:hypothetical protein
MASSSSSSRSTGLSTQQQQQQQQQQQVSSSGPQAGPPAWGSLQDQLDVLRVAGRAAADAAQQRRAGREALSFGPGVEFYDLQKGVLLPVLPPDGPAAGVRPVSTYAQYCRIPHWDQQSLQGFNSLLLEGHEFTGPITSLPTTGEAVMQPLGVVGTVCGNNREGRSSCVHFAEHRMLSKAERVSFSLKASTASVCL